jgi:hypothetical protein
MHAAGTGEQLGTLVLGNLWKMLGLAPASLPNFLLHIDLFPERPINE